MGIRQRQTRRAAPARAAESDGLTLGPRHDATEREADGMAERAAAGMATLAPPATVQREATAGAGPSAAGVAEAASAVASGGRGLSGAERGFFEPRFRRDLSDVRVHEGPAAGAAAKSIRARAYTLGHDIAFAPGAYTAGTPGGQRLMAHELAHVMQQAGQTGPVIQRAPPEGGTTEAEEDAALSLDQALTYLEDGHAGKIFQEDLSQMGDYELRRIADYAKTKRGRLMEQAKKAKYPKQQDTLESEAHQNFVVANMALKTLIRRGRARQATEFKAISAKVRAELQGDAHCFYDSVSPYVPHYLTPLLEGGKATENPQHKYKAGYLALPQVQGLVSDTGKLTLEKLNRAFTNTPERVAEAFHRLGDQPQRIANVVDHHFRAMGQGIVQLKPQIEKYGSGADNAENAVVLIETIDAMILDHNTAYACFGRAEGIGGTQTDEDKERQAAVGKAAETHARKSMEQVGNQLVPTHKVQVLGLEPK